MIKQLLSITVFMYTVSVIINAFGKVDAYLTQSASYSWTDSDLDNIIPDENDDVFQKPHSYFAYSIHDNEDSNYINKENNNIIEEVVVPLSNLAELSPNRDSGNETEKSEEESKKEFMNDMHELINALVEQSGAENMPFEEEQEQEEEQEVAVPVPLLDEDLTFDPTEEVELFSLTVPESQKHITENRPQKEPHSPESNPLLISALPKESINEGFLMPSNTDDVVRNQKSITPSSETDDNGGTGEVILEMDLFPVENEAPLPEHMPTHHSDLSQEKPLLPFLFSTGLPDTMLAHASWQSLLYPTTSKRHHFEPSTKFYVNTNGEVKHINPRKILNSLKATSIGKMEYQPLGDHLYSMPIVYDDLAHIYGHSPYQNDDISYGALDLGLLRGGISVDNLESKYMHQNPYVIVSSVDAVKQLEMMMNPTKRLLRKIMVIQPPAVLRIEPVICHRAYKHPQTHITF